MRNELVTVSISTYNRIDGLIETLKTVINQSYKNIEIIIVDDFSLNSKIFEIVKNYFPDEQRMIFLRHETNKGLAAARNTALKKSKGKFFTFIDDDDLWDKNCIENFIKYTLRFNSLNCFCGGIKYNNRSYKYFSKQILLSEAIYQGWTPPVSAQFYYKKSLIEMGGFNEDIKSGVDHDIWLNLSIKNYNIVFIEECVSILSNNLSKEKMTSNYNLLTITRRPGY